VRRSARGPNARVQDTDTGRLTNGPSPSDGLAGLHFEAWFLWGFRREGRSGGRGSGPDRDSRHLFGRNYCRHCGSHPKRAHSCRVSLSPRLTTSLLPASCGLFRFPGARLLPRAGAATLFPLGSGG